MEDGQIKKICLELMAIRKVSRLLIKIVSACSIRQISQLSLFALSSENLNRPDYEVQFLLKLFEDSINKYINDLHSNNVRIKFIGKLRIIFF